MKCVLCGGKGIQMIHTTDTPIYTSWKYYCATCIALAKISGQLQRNPMTHREQWYNEEVKTKCTQ